MLDATEPRKFGYLGCLGGTNASLVVNIALEADISGRQETMKMRVFPCGCLTDDDWSVLQHGNRFRRNFEIVDVTLVVKFALSLRSELPRLTPHQHQFGPSITAEPVVFECRC